MSSSISPKNKERMQSRNMRLEDENKLSNLYQHTKILTPRKEDSDLIMNLREMRNSLTNYDAYRKNKITVFEMEKAEGNERTSSNNLLKKNLHNHLMFTTIAKERKFKSYIQNKNDQKSQSLRSNGENLSVKKMKISEKNKKTLNQNSTLASLISISNLSTRPTHNSTLFFDHSKGDFGTFLTSKNDYLQDKKDREEREEHKNIQILKNIFSKNLKDAKLFNTINLVPLSFTGRQLGNKIVKDKKPTIDPDFFIKNKEKEVEKKSILNFTANPTLFKSFSNSARNTFYDQSKPETFINSELKTVRNLKIISKNRSKHDSVKMENFQNYNETFNKVSENDFKIQTDFKDLIYNTRSNNFYKSLDVIRDLIKGEIKARSFSRSGYPNNIGPQKKKVQSNRDITGMLKEIKESKERILDNYRDSANAIFSSLNDIQSEVLNNETNTSRTQGKEYLDKEELNVLGYDVNSSFYKKSQEKLKNRNNKTPTSKSNNFKRIYKPGRLSQNINNSEFEKMFENPKSKKNAKPPLTIPIQNNRVYKNKISPNDMHLFRRMKFQDQKITHELMKIFPKDSIDKAIKTGGKINKV